MIRMYIPNEIMLQLSDSIELVTTNDLFGNRIGIKYNNKIFTLDRSFYPQLNLLTRDIDKLKDFRSNNMDSRFFIPYNTHRCNDNSKSKCYYLNNLNKFIENKIQNYYESAIQIGYWELANCKLVNKSSVIFSMIFDDYPFQPYDVALKLASGGASNIVYYDPCLQYSNSLNQLTDISSYFDWNIAVKDNTYVTISNVQTNKLNLYFTWCNDHYLDYFINLLSIDFTELPCYNSLNDAFTCIVGGWK